MDITFSFHKNKDNSLYYKILIIFIIIINFDYFIIKKSNYLEIKNKIINTNILLKKINETFALNDHVNINEIESKFLKNRLWKKNINKTSEINIGIQLDPNYVLRVMITLASIMDSQKPKTKIRFHFAVVQDFRAEDMLKIYSLRERIRDDVEFNFYNAKRVEIDLLNLNTKGPGAVSKLLLPELLPDDIKRLIVFDTGDLLVLRDLSEMYNWNMSNYLYLGLPGAKAGTYALIKKIKFQTYINTGSFLINVDKVKKEHIYEKFVKYKYLYKSGTGDQNLLNDVANGKIGYLPIKFGLRPPYKTDYESDHQTTFKNPYNFYFKKYYKEILPFIPNNKDSYFQLG